MHPAGCVFVGFLLEVYLCGVPVSSLAASTTIGVLSTAPWSPGERGSYESGKRGQDQNPDDISPLSDLFQTCTRVFNGVSFDVSTSLLDTAIGVRETSSEADLEEECCSEL